MQPDPYIPDDQILPAVEAIAKLKPCPFFGEVTRDQVLLALGEFGIGPEHSRPDDEPKPKPKRKARR